MSPYGNGYGNDLYIKSPDPSLSSTITTFEIGSSDTYDANAHIEVNRNCSITAEPSSKIIIGKYADLFFEIDEAQSQGINGGKMTLNNNSSIFLKENSNTYIYAGGKIINEGSIFSCESNANISVSTNGEYIISENVTNNQIISNGAKMTLNGGTLRIGDNSILIYDGQGTHLTVNQGSSIQLGHNAKIEFKTGHIWNQTAVCSVLWTEQILRRDLCSIMRVQVQLQITLLIIFRIRFMFQTQARLTNLFTTIFQITRLTLII